MSKISMKINFILDKNLQHFSWFCKTVKYFENFVCKLYQGNSFISATKLSKSKKVCLTLYCRVINLNSLQKEHISSAVKGLCNEEG